jgi:hypothetical protein
MPGVKALPVLACLLMPLGILAQQSPNPPRPAYDGSANPDAAHEIYIDQDCRILPGATAIIPGKKAKPFTDSTICHLETVNNSEHMEERIVGNELYRSKVRIVEQEYVLQNIAVYPVIFVVEQGVPEGWVVDSDPQPSEVNQSTAVFPVHAQPGEIVRLHVGMRNAKPLKAKTVKTSPPPPASANQSD